MGENTCILQHTHTHTHVDAHIKPQNGIIWNCEEERKNLGYRLHRVKSA